MLFFSAKSFSCSCVGRDSVKIAIKNADYVFIGECITEKDIIVNVRYGEPDIVKQYDFQIISLYKGNVHSDTIRIYTGTGGGDCGYYFELGKKYIIYAKWKNRYIAQIEDVPKFLYTNICMRTTLLSDYEKNSIEKLRKPRRIKNRIHIKNDLNKTTNNFYLKIRQDSNSNIFIISNNKLNIYTPKYNSTKRNYSIQKKYSRKIIDNAIIKDMEMKVENLLCHSPESIQITTTDIQYDIYVKMNGQERLIPAANTFSNEILTLFDAINTLIPKNKPKIKYL